MGKSKIKSMAVIRGICFFIIFIILLLSVSKVFVPYSSETTSQTDSFYKLEKNTIDVLIVGTSTIFVGISPLQLYEEEGIVAHTRASSMQPPIITYLNIKEAYEYQNPCVVIMGIASLFSEYNVDENEARVRRGMDDKKLSVDKINCAIEIAQRSSYQKAIDYIFPVLRYHSRWEEITLSSVNQVLDPPYDYMRGQLAIYEVKSINPRDHVDKSVNAEEYNKESWKWYKKAINYCKERGAKVIVVNMPSHKWNYGQYLTAHALLSQEEVAYIDFNLESMVKELPLDWNIDFYNENHLNPIGAEKVTKFLAEYLVDNYKIPQYACTENVENGILEDLEKYTFELDNFKTRLYQ